MEVDGSDLDTSRTVEVPIHITSPLNSDSVLKRYDFLIFSGEGVNWDGPISAALTQKLSALMSHSNLGRLSDFSKFHVTFLIPNSMNWGSWNEH